VPEYACNVRALLLALVALLAVGCGSSSAHHTDPTAIRFGITGGNIPRYDVTMQPNGRVRIRNAQGRSRVQIAPALVRRFQQEIQGAHLVSRRCPGALPDLAAEYIRVDGRTFTVHGGCEPRFQRVWHDLVRVLPRRPG
jgi:hypothetical protein